MKPIIVLSIKDHVMELQLNHIKKHLNKKMGDDYRVIILINCAETKIQVFTDKEIMPTELQAEFDKLLQPC